MNTVSFYISVECDAHSRHRDPSGVYRVDVVEEDTLLQSASAAIEIIKARTAFLDENSGKVKTRVFLSDGGEVRIPIVLSSKYHDHGNFHGRVKEYPDEITFQ